MGAFRNEKRKRRHVLSDDDDELEEGRFGREDDFRMTGSRSPVKEGNAQDKSSGEGKGRGRWKRNIIKPPQSFNRKCLFQGRALSQLDKTFSRE
jgi:hypothetical protein